MRHEYENSHHDAPSSHHEECPPANACCGNAACGSGSGCRERSLTPVQPTAEPVIQPGPGRQPMRIAVVRNRSDAGVIRKFGRPCPESYGKKAVQAVLDSLRAGGYEAMAFEGDMTLPERLREYIGGVDELGRPNGLVFNMGYGIQGDSRYTHVPAMLEMSGVPYTGADPLGHAVSLDKVITKILIADAGVPTPRYAVLRDASDPIGELTYPLIVKPRHESTSFGLQVVRDEPSLRAAVAAIVATYRQDALVEEFIDGSEYCVALLGNAANGTVETLPIVEMDFGNRELNALTWADKFHKTADEPTRVCPARVDEALGSRLRELAIRTFRACHCRDYSRVDFRVDRQGNPYVLEINSMASLGGGGSYVLAAKTAGYRFDELVCRIVDLAHQRYFGEIVPTSKRSATSEGQPKFDDDDGDAAPAAAPTTPPATAPIVETFPTPMVRTTPSAPERPKYRAITRANIGSLPQWQSVDPEIRRDLEAVSLVLPFRTNEYLVNQLIDWDNVPNDPIFQLTFSQRGMLAEEDFRAVRDGLDRGMSAKELEPTVAEIRRKLNPHPGGQSTHNVPMLDGRALEGLQHKYRETVLFFPSAGQTCHAYCSFCFRWAQFVETDDVKFAASETSDLTSYLERHPGVTDVLFTGGDPMIMSAATMKRYIEPLLDVETVKTIRIGTKAPLYWPQRFVSDPDADELLRLFERIVDRGKHLAIMTHLSHPVELSTEVTKQAFRRIRATGANMRLQSPVIRHVNDDPNVWSRMWTDGVRMGALPYYMFVERDTGAKRYFELPLVRCWEIFRDAFQQVSGTARTARGPVMSAFPGKCHFLGVTEIEGQKAFALEYLQARQHELVRRPFFARFDAKATWYDQLRPLREIDRPFFPALGLDPHAITTPLTVSADANARSAAPLA